MRNVTFVAFSVALVLPERSRRKFHLGCAAEDALLFKTKCRNHIIFPKKWIKFTRSVPAVSHPCHMEPPPLEVRGEIGVGGGGGGPELGQGTSPPGGDRSRAVFIKPLWLRSYKYTFLIWIWEDDVHGVTKLLFSAPKTFKKYTFWKSYLASSPTAMSLPKKRVKVIQNIFSIDNNCYFLTPFEPLPKNLPPIAAVLVPSPVGLGTGNIHTSSLFSENVFLFMRHW